MIQMAAALDPELTCPICLELFQDPVALPCMHSYCRGCLASILQSNVDRRGGVQCPECREVAMLDDGGVAKLPRNFSLANIVAKYSKSEESLVPCDICDEKPPANAIKCCMQCKFSYCVQCLFFHPKKGVLSKHRLVDPKVSTVDSFIFVGAFFVH